MIKECQSKKLIPGDTDSTVLLVTKFLDLSKQKSGDGSFTNMFTWHDLLSYIATNIHKGIKLKVYTIGSDHLLISDNNRLVIKDIYFAPTLGQRIDFVSYRPCMYNIPTIGYATPLQSTMPLISIEGCSGLRLGFSRFRISCKNQPFMLIKDSYNCMIEICDNSLTTVGDSVENASFAKFEDSDRLQVVLLHNTIVDLSLNVPDWDAAIILETNIIYRNPAVAGMFDIGNAFDSGSRFDKQNIFNTNIFYLIQNYISYRAGLYNLFRTDNYHTKVRKRGNIYKTLP